jgi:hypothetical protein
MVLRIARKEDRGHPIFRPPSPPPAIGDEPFVLEHNPTVEIRSGKKAQ